MGKNNWSMAVILLFAAGSAMAQASNELTDLGTLGGNSSRAEFVNESGQVVGTSNKADPIPYSHAFSWTESTGIVDIIATDPAISSVAIESNVAGLTNSGIVLGQFTVNTGYYPHAYVWSAAGGLIDLTFPGDLASQIRRVSASGQAAGISYYPGSRGFHWSEQEGVVELGLPAGAAGLEVTGISGDGHYVIVVGADIGGQPMGTFLWSAANGFVSTEGCGPGAVNDLGEVTGFFYPLPPPEPPYACFWSETTGFVDLLANPGAIGQFINNAGEVAGSGNTAFYWKKGMAAAVHLGALAGIGSEPTGLTEDGMMVGVVVMQGGTNRAFVSQSGGPMQEVGLGGHSYPRAVSANGQLVGLAYLPAVPGYIPARGFSWTAAGGAVEMPTLPGGQIISEATAVNNRGQVVGMSATENNNRVIHAVLWNTRPLPPPVPLLLHRSTDGRWFNYQIADNAIGSKGFLDLTRSAAYSVVSRSDFDGDGAPDLLLRDLTPTREENGRWVLYTLSDSTVTSQGFVDGLTRNADWEVMSTEDFDGDDKADLLVRNTMDGRWLLYLLDSHVIKSQAVMPLSADLTDTLQGVGDFNGDGRADVLLRRADGSWLEYQMDGLGTPVSGSPAMTTALAFSLQSLGDFNGDGKTDVLLRRTDGRWFVYMLDGATTLSSGSPAMTQVTDFVLSEVADFSGDGKSDVLLRRQSDGRWFLYTLDGTQILASGAPEMSRNLAFEVVSTGDFSSDGKADVLMRRSDGRWVLYQMDGPMVATKSVPDMTRNMAWAPQVP